MNPTSPHAVPQSPTSPGGGGHPYSPPNYAAGLPARPPSPVISDEKIRNEEWKYSGYPAFSKWMNSSNDFLVLRRFGQLGTRAALLLQDDLVQIEEDIRTLDIHTMSQPDGQGFCGSFYGDRGSPREALLRDAIPKLQQYWEFMEAFSRWKTQPGAQDVQVKNVEMWLRKHHGAIRQEERSFVRKEGDLVALVLKPKSLLRLFLEQFKFLRRMFRLPHRDDRERSEKTRYYSDRHFETFTSFVIVVGGLLMLFGPLWWLNVVDDPFKRVGIITGFVTVFAVLLFCATTSATRGFEVLAATAAYAAVLAVFLQSSGSGSSGGSASNGTSSLVNSTHMVMHDLAIAYRNFVS